MPTRFSTRKKFLPLAILGFLLLAIFAAGFIDDPEGEVTGPGIMLIHDGRIIGAGGIMGALRLMRMSVTEFDPLYLVEGTSLLWKANIAVALLLGLAVLGLVGWQGRNLIFQPKI